MTDEIDELMRSSDWEDRVRAVQALRGRRAPEDLQRLTTLLHDQGDKAVVYEAAPALFAAGEPGWTIALESVWWDGDEDDTITFAAYEALVQLVLADEDVEARLLDFVDHPRSDSSRRGANEMMIALQMREPADLEPAPDGPQDGDAPRP